MRGSSLEVDPAGRTLIEDLCADPQILQILYRHGVHVPGETGWRVAAPVSVLCTTLPADQVRELYVDVGLNTSHIALLCGVGQSAARGPLTDPGITLRPSRAGPCPWNRRRRSG